MENKYQLVMVKHMQNNHGFTMIETLFVLFVICILSVLSMIFHQPVKKDSIVIKEITEFLNEAKLSAMLAKQTVTVEFQKDRILYSHLDKEKEHILEKNTYFDSYNFTFNENGNINRAKTITYHYHDQQYQFVYQIGSGSFYVQ